MYSQGRQGQQHQVLPPLGAGEEYTLRTDPARLYDPEGDGKIVDWRILCFMRLGFESLQASALAVRKDIDREAVARLIGRGATPDQVYAILA
jgi:hypothetical protein